jgi:hypothetical protein
MKRNLILGCDPEFTIVNGDGELLPASKFFSGGGELGVDGNSALAELRPGISTNPLELVGRIASLLEQGYQTVREQGVSNFTFLAGPIGAGERPQGGHIHLGGASLTAVMLKNLSAITSALEMSFFNPVDVLRRRSGYYGKVGSFKRKAHGIEWRQPVSWLSTPEIAYLFLASIKIVGDNPLFNLGIEDTEVVKEATENLSQFSRLVQDADLFIQENCKEVAPLITELLGREKKFYIVEKESWGIKCAQ